MTRIALGALLGIGGTVATMLVMHAWWRWENDVVVPRADGLAQSAGDGDWRPVVIGWDAMQDTASRSAGRIIQ